MSFDLNTIFTQWESMGVFNIVLPLLLIFTLAFAILNKVKILGGKKNIDVIVAFIIALLTVRNQYIIGLVNRFLPNISLFLVVILMFLLMLGIFAGEHTGWKGGMLGIATLVSVLFVIWALSADYIGERFSVPDWWYSVDEQTKATIVFVAIFVIIIAWVTKEPGQKGGGFGDWIKERMQEISGK